MAWVHGASADDSCGSGVGGGGRHIYWLNGMAGTGKSTIARTIARRCSDAGRLGASFFLLHGGRELETARTFITSIAVQLAQRAPALRKNICRTLCCAHGDIAEQMLSDQWRQLVLRLCARLATASAKTVSGSRLLSQIMPLVVVVNALNECTDATEVEFVLQLLSEPSALAVAQLLIFLTSRPELVICHRLLSLTERECWRLILHRIDPSVVDSDIALFFQHSLSIVKGERALPSAWPGYERLHQLVQ
jgi:hypothetical protein